MKKILINLIFLVSSYYFCQAQLLSQKFGEVTYKDFNFTKYEKAPEASAVVIFDVGKSAYVREGDGWFNIVHTRTKRVKIFDDAGLDEAEIAIRYYVDGYDKTEKVIRIKAYCYNLENGRIVKSELDPKTVFVEKENELWRRKKFAIPGVKAGSIIEYQYELISPFLGNMPDWEFQTDIPTIRSSYTVKLTPFYEFIYLLQGRPKFSKKKSYLTGIEQNIRGVKYREMAHEFEMRDIPAFTDDEFITSRNDYIIKVDFQLSKTIGLDGTEVERMTSWEKINNDYLKNQSFGKFINSAEKYSSKNIISDLELPGKSQREIIKSITTYVKNNYSWDEWYGRFPKDGVRDLIKSKSGSAAGLNLFLTGALRSAGIEADPILVSTRSHGKVNPDYPFAHFFNYVAVIAKTDNGYVMMDATEPNLPYDYLPIRCLNDVGLIVKKNASPWVSLRSNASSQKVENSLVSVDISNNEITSQITIQSTKYDAYALRRSYSANKEKFSEGLIGEGEELVNDLKAVNAEKPAAPFVYSYLKKSAIESFEGKLYLSPFDNIGVSENPLKMKKRDYPVDLVYKKARKFSSTIQLPDGYQLREAPSNFAYEDELVKIQYTSEIKETSISINAEYSFKKSEYPPEDFDQLKINFGKIHRVFSKQLELERKS